MSPRTPDSEVLTPQHGNRHVALYFITDKNPAQAVYKIWQKTISLRLKKSRGNPGFYFGAPGGFPRYPQVVDTCGAFVSTQTAPKACFRLLVVERVRIQIAGCTITKQIPTNKSWGFILAHHWYPKPNPLFAELRRSAQYICKSNILACIQVIIKSDVWRAVLFALIATKD